MDREGKRQEVGRETGGRGRRQAVRQTWSESRRGGGAHREGASEAWSDISHKGIGGVVIEKGVEDDIEQVEKSQGGMADDLPDLGDTETHSSQSDSIL